MDFSNVVNWTAATSAFILILQSLAANPAVDPRVALVSSAVLTIVSALGGQKNKPK